MTWKPTRPACYDPIGRRNDGVAGLACNQNANPEQGISLPAALRLQALTMPVLVLVGEYDLPDFQAIAAQMAAMRPRPAHWSCLTPATGSIWKRQRRSTTS